MERKQEDGIWIIDADAKTAYANERMAEILGTSPSEMVGRASFAYVFPEDVEQLSICSRRRYVAIPTRFTSSCAERTARLFGSMCRELRCTMRQRIQRNRGYVQRFNSTNI
jgi:PAS domain S-box-containing protein